MDLFTIVSIVLVAGLAAYGLFKSVSLAKVKDFGKIVAFVSTAVLAVEQISSSTSEIAQLPAGEEKNALRKNLALSIIQRYAEEIGYKLDEKAILVLGFVVESVVRQLKN